MANLFRNSVVVAVALALSACATVPTEPNSEEQAEESGDGGGFLLLLAGIALGAVIFAAASDSDGGDDENCRIIVTSGRSTRVCD